MRKLMICLMMASVLFVGCAGKTAHKNNFLGEYYRNLTPGLEGGVKLRWAKPGVDFGKYRKFMVDYAVFYLSPDSESAAIDGDEMKRLGDACTKAIIDALKDKYPIVTEPGPDVARLRFAIVDLKQSRPALSAASLATPIGLGISLVKKGATDTWSGAGATTSQLMMLDSQTNTVIAAGEDEHSAGFTGRFSKWGSAEEAFKFWGQRIRTLMDRVTDKTA